jgi:penicillin-binding protein 2
MSVIHTNKRPQLDARVLVFPVVCGLLLLTVFLRLWYFQVVLGPELSEEGTLADRSSVPTLAPRGLIFDRTGKLVAGIRPQLVITAVPSVMKKNPGVLKKLAEILQTTESNLDRKLKKAERQNMPTSVFVGASIEAGSRIAEAGDLLPGVGIETQPMRYYPDPSALGHILGNVWVPDTQDIKRFDEDSEAPPHYVGKFGVEWYYERDLMGVPGEESVEMDSKRRPSRVVSRQSALPGSRLILSIDSSLQKLALDRLGNQLGAVVAIEPSSGEILAMASSPSLDLSKFEGGISVDDYKALLENEDKPYLNRAVSGVYAPGSTFKVVTSLAAYETGHLNLGEEVFCDGGYHFKGPNGTRGVTIKCLGFHGRISYKKAFEKSCNTFFCNLGLQVGAEAIAKAADEFGLGDPTKIDLRSDSGGLIPSPDWKESHRHKKWYGGDTANTAIGQGFVLTTPLQMADVAATIANRGTLYRPHLVSAIKKPGSDVADPVQPEVMRQIKAGSDFWSTLIDAMVGVVNEGTAVVARLPETEWAGKTGSAEHGANLITHSWFIGFAPADNPKIAIAVLVENAGHGAEVAAPIARDVVKAYLDGLSASANRPSASSKDAPAASTRATSAGRPSAP